MRSLDRHKTLVAALDALNSQVESAEDPVLCRVLLGDGSTAQGELTAVSNSRITLSEVAGVGTLHVPVRAVFRLQVAQPDRRKEWLFAAGTTVLGGAVVAGLLLVPGLFVEHNAQRVLVVVFAGGLVATYKGMRTRLRSWLARWKELA